MKKTSEQDSSALFPNAQGLNVLERNRKKELKKKTETKTSEQPFFLTRTHMVSTFLEKQKNIKKGPKLNTRRGLILEEFLAFAIWIRIPI